MSEPAANWNLAAISLGSNIDPAENLQAAVCELANFGTVQKVSRVWESAPVGFLEQANFLNSAVLLETAMSAAELKQNALCPIEQKLHRIRDPKNINAPRTIDLDLSIFITPAESIVMDDNILSRAFVAVPLAELLPEFVHPATGQTLAQIAQQLKNSANLIPFGA